MSITLDLSEWQTASPATHPQLRNLWLPDDDATQQLVQQLARSKRLSLTQERKGLTITTYSFVGCLTIGQLQLTIRPKVSGMPLLRLLQYAFSLRDVLTFTPHTQETEVWTFQDLLIAQLISEIRELLQRGLQKQYMRREGELASPQGRIDFQRLARHSERFQTTLPCISYTRQQDTPLNRTLLSGVRLASQMANDAALRLQLQHLEHSDLANLTPLRLDQTHLVRLRQNQTRLTAAYSPALTLIELLFNGHGIGLIAPEEDTENPSRLLLPGFLLDMNRFFQNLLGRFLREHLPEYEVLHQYEFTDMLSYVENPHQRKAPRPRPDYIVKDKENMVAILDAKYRDLWLESLPTHMLYQLVMYAMGQDSCDTTIILYPTLLSIARDARIEVHVPGHVRGRVSVILRPVDLTGLDAALQGNRSQRERLARTIVLGQVG